MRIHEYGEIILCKNITFEDNQLDMQLGHPGIILLPTSEKEEEIHCLYMTSDGKRASKEYKKFVKHTSKVAKTSYINLQQIVKRINIKDTEMSRLDDDEFRDILQTFYNYQISLEPQKQDFLEIKSKIETLLEILDFNKEFNIFNPVSRKELDILDTVKNKTKRKMIYGANLCITGNRSDSQNLENQFFASEKDKKYCQNLIKAYDMIKCLNFDKIDFNNPNNEIRQIYINLRNENYLINIDTLFKDVSTIFNMTNDNDKISKLINDFVNFEQNREVAKAKAKEDKRNRKEESKKSKRSKTQDRALRKKASDIAKYGNFDWR